VAAVPAAAAASAVQTSVPAGGSEGGGSGIGAGGSGDLGPGGPGPMQTTAMEYGALASIAASGLLGAGYDSGWSGASLGVATAIASSFGVNLDTAMGHLSHDLAASMAWGGMDALMSGQ
jgi:hypothetical protein